MARSGGGVGVGGKIPVKSMFVGLFPLSGINLDVFVRPQMINNCTFCLSGRILKSWKSDVFMLPTVKVCICLLSVVLRPPFFTACKSLLNKKSDSAKVKSPVHPSRLWESLSVCVCVCPPQVRQWFS